MTTLYTRAGSIPATLPERYITPEGHVRTMPEQWTGEELAAWGFVFAPPRPDDTEAQTAEWDGDDWIMVDRPPAPPEPEPEPRVIGKGEFLDLFLAAGVPLAKVREASADERLVDFWFALNNFYSQIRRDHPSTVQGIGAMVALGHVTQAQANAVVAGWPVE